MELVNEEGIHRIDGIDQEIEMREVEASTSRAGDIRVHSPNRGERIPRDHP